MILPGATPRSRLKHHGRRIVVRESIISVTMDFVGSGKASITRRMSCFASTTGGFRAFLRGSRTPCAGFAVSKPQALP